MATLDPMRLRVRHRGTEIEVTPGDVVTIGSDPAATLTVVHPGVSRRHASVAFVDGSWEYRDEASTNGSFVDGARIEAARIDGQVTVLMGHDAEGEPIDLLSDSPPSAGVADPGRMRRIEVALWVIAAAAVAGVAVAIAALLT